MKKTLAILLLFTGLATYSQTPLCKTTEVLNSLITTNPQMQERVGLINNEIYRKKSNNGKAAFILPPQESILIPVVFYIVHDGSSTFNLSDTQIQQQLTALNSKFLTTGLKFCLATRAGSGSLIPTDNIPSGVVQNTPGIVHIQNASLMNHTSDAMGQFNLLSTAHPSVTGDKYLRIWIVKSIDNTSTTLGYAWFPNGSLFYDGIVITSNVCGAGTSNLAPGYAQGETLVHEVGHYLGLYHTFEGACLTPFNDPLQDGDLVADTPRVGAPNFNCPISINSCPESPAVLDLVHNYMDYGDDGCKDSFTLGQQERMIYLLNSYRSNLYSLDNLLYTGGSCGATNLLSATIKPSSYTVCQNTTATSFEALPAVTYSWDFGDAFATPSNPNTSTLQNPTHLYTSAAGSPYTVTLTVTGNGGSATSSIQVYVTNCTPINTPYSNWFTGHKNMLSFSTGIPVFNTSFPSLNHQAFGNGNSISDASGNLLFYNNGFEVWNNLHNSLNTIGIGNQASRGIIVPVPGNPNEYNIYNSNLYFGSNAATTMGLEYSRININNGVAVSANPVRQPVTIPSGYLTGLNGAIIGGAGIAAIRVCNGDYWILTTGIKTNNNSYYLLVYRLTSTGLSFVNEALLNSAASGSKYYKIECAPNGNKIFVYQSFGENYIYDFDKITGTVSNRIAILFSPVTNVKSSSFSADSRLLYMINGEGEYINRINQYNLNSLNINATRKIVATINTPGGIGIAQLDMEMGPDNKIYFNTITNNPENHCLGVIHAPNLLATPTNPNACQAMLTGPGITNAMQTLPNNIDAKQETAYFDANNSSVISDYLTSSCNTYKFFPNICGTSFIWEFTNTSGGATVTSTLNNPTYTFPATGIYTITLKNTANIVLGTLTKSIIAPSSNISGSQGVCSNAPSITNHSTTLLPGETALWTVTGGTITGGVNTSSSVNVSWQTLPGQVSLTVTNASGCSSTSVKTITVSPPPNPVITGDFEGCQTNEYYNTTVNSVQLLSGETAVWSIVSGQGTIIGANNSNNVTIQWDELPGEISLTVTNSAGCSRTIIKKIDKLCSCDCFEHNYFTTTINANTVQFQLLNNTNSPLCPLFVGMKQWNFGDGTYSFDESPIHTYAAIGNYNVSLLTSATQCSSEYSAYVPITSLARISNPNANNFSYRDATVFPNPTKSYFNVGLHLFNDSEVSIIVRSIDGKTLNTIKSNFEKGNQIIPVNLQNISKGVLLIEIKSESNSVIKKLIVE